MAVIPSINPLTEKTTIVDADIVLIEDSADTYAKKKVQRSTLTGHRDTLALVDQTASITPTNFTNSQTAGCYLLAYTLECTTSDGAAVSVLATFSWTDSAGATSHATDALALTTAGRKSAVIMVQVASGAFTYATTVDTIGSAKYALYADVIRLS